MEEEDKRYIDQKYLPNRFHVIQDDCLMLSKTMIVLLLLLLFEKEHRNILFKIESMETLSKKEYKFITTHFCFSILDTIFIITFSSGMLIILVIIRSINQGQWPWYTENIRYHTLNISFKNKKTLETK